MGGVISAVLDNDDSDDEYEILDGDQDIFEDISVGTRNYDCIMVFDTGRDVDWTPVEHAEKLHYEYVNLLDSHDMKRRNTRFVSSMANNSHQTMPTESEFYAVERKLIVKILKQQKLKVNRIVDMGVDFEREKHRVFYFVGMREVFARQFAHQCEYELELNPRAAIQYLNLQDDSLATATVSDDEYSSACVEDYWKHMFARYHRHVAPEVFKTYDLLDEGDSAHGFDFSLFSIRDRCYLINEMVNRDIESHGAGLFVRQLAEKDHPLVDFFPIHTVPYLDDIMADMLAVKSLAQLPLDKFRAYFGEYIALYFAYLQYFTWFLVPAAVVGFWFAMYQFIEGKVVVDGISYFSILVILWAIFYPLLWRNAEYWYAAKWGTLRFDLTEPTRPEFEGIFIRSQVTGELYEYYPPGQRAVKQLVTLGAAMAFVLGLAGSFMGVIFLRLWVSSSDELSFADYWVAFANALIIIFFNSIYGIFAENMNEYENYKTETEYENALIFKVFIFRFINSYATLYYIAFLRPLESSSSSLYCDSETCMEALRIQLAVVFIAQLLVSNSIELGQLVLTSYFRGGAPSFKATDIRKKIWNEYTAVTYHRTFDDYCELVITFGYCSLFCLAFPLAPLFGLIAAFVEAKIDGYKLCRLSRRPFPRQADDIGTWQFAMEFMAYAVLVTNLGLVCFVTNDLDFTFLEISSEAFEEVVTAAIVFALLSIVIRIANFMAMRKPTKIIMHEKRQEHINKSLTVVGNRIAHKFRKMPDEDVKNWEKWSATEVKVFMRDVLIQNGDALSKYGNKFVARNFNGKAFAVAEDHDFQDMGFNDYYINLFFVNCRRMLENRLIDIGATDEIMNSIENETSFGGSKRKRGKKDGYDSDEKHNGGRGDLFSEEDMSEDEKGNVTRGRLDSDAEVMDSKGQFRFTLDYFPTMADFYDEDFNGQSKRKLYERVDKDSSQIIEEWELSGFIYYSIAIYIKTKHRNAIVPKMDDEMFNKHTIDPLKAWLLRNKIVDSVGLKFDEFDRYFSSWLRQYYREKSDEIQINVVGSDSDGRAQGAGLFSKGNKGKGGKKGSKENPHLTRAYRKGHLGSNAAERTRAAQKRDGTPDKALGIGDSTIQRIGYKMSEMSAPTISSSASKLTPKVARAEWTKESKEWLGKLRLVADSAARVPEATRERLYNRLDKKKRGKVNTDKQLGSLIYTFFALYARSQDKSAKLPKSDAMQPLLIEICYEIRPNLSGSSLYMQKEDFLKNIDVYLQSAATNLLSK